MKPLFICQIVYTIFITNLITSCACRCADNSCLAPTPSLGRSPPLIKNGSSDGETAGALRSVFFDYKSVELNPSARDSLRHNIQYLLLHPTLTVVIEGHADNIGGKEYNLKLATKRTETIKIYMVKNAVPPVRISAKSVGDAAPLSQNDNAEEERKKDRRVNFIIKDL